MPYIRVHHFLIGKAVNISLSEDTEDPLVVVPNLEVVDDLELGAISQYPRETSERPFFPEMIPVANKVYSSD